MRAVGYAERSKLAAFVYCNGQIRLKAAHTAGSAYLMQRMDCIQIIKDVGLPTGMILFAGWFLVARAWPYYTTTNTSNAKDLHALLATQANTMIEMKALLQSMDRRLEHVEDSVDGVGQHLADLRRDSARTLTGLDTLAAQMGERRSGQDSAGDKPKRARSAKRTSPSPS